MYGYGRRIHRVVNARDTDTDSCSRYRMEGKEIQREEGGRMKPPWSLAKWSSVATVATIFRTLIGRINRISSAAKLTRGHSRTARAECVPQLRRKFFTRGMDVWYVVLPMDFGRGNCASATRRSGEEATPPPPIPPYRPEGAHGISC